MMGLRDHQSASRMWEGAVTSLFILLLCANPLAQAQTFAVLYTFAGKGDGRYPEARLLAGKAGGLFSTTSNGGSFDYGTIFTIDSHGTETVLHSFWSGDGSESLAGLIEDGAGNFYGTTYDGGTPEGGECVHGCGSVFKLDPAGKLTVLHAFTGGTDGGQPEAALIQDDVGNLYGTTTVGGDLSCGYGGLGCGVVFKVDTYGNETVLHAFSGQPDGSRPSGELLPDGKGNFYGTTWFGGASDYGTVFKLDSTDTETVLFSFDGNPGGEYPNGPLVADAQGNVYGTTNGGGDSSCYLCGVIFRIDSSGNETVLHTLTGAPNDGAFPYAGLIRDTSGNLYGTTWAGGSAGCLGLGCGTVFEVDVNGNETVLHGFSGGTDGGAPRERLIIDRSGNLYGTAPEGGNPSCGGGVDSGCGVVFKIVP
jgi:uncharacterized repeat protein (TIGR03803 family)